MSKDDDEDRSWRLFSSEDMIDGYKALKRRKTARSLRRGQGFGDAETEKMVFNTPEATNSSSISSANPTSLRLTNKSTKKFARSLSRAQGFSESETENIVFNTPEAPDSSNMFPANSTCINLYPLRLLRPLMFLKISVRLTSKSTKKASQPNDKPVRIPFTDITNNCSSFRTKKQPAKEKVKTVPSRWENATLSEWSRNLFDEEFNGTHSTSSVIYDEINEETRVPGSYLSDDSETSYEDDYVDNVFDDSSGGESDQGQ
ncbi:hypothetical protein ACET3Z_024760 [Daucus carota]